MSSARRTGRGRACGRISRGTTTDSWTRPLLSRAAGRFADLLDDEPDAEKLAALWAPEGIGRPLGSDAFLNRVAALMGRNPQPGKLGRKQKPAAAETIRN